MKQDLISSLKYAIIPLSTRTEYAGFVNACNHNLTLVSKALAISFRAVLVDAQARNGEGFVVMAKSIKTYISIRTTRNNIGASRRGSFGKIPPKDILLRMELQGWKCLYCKDVISLFTCEYEHVYPISRGGENYLYNLVLSCHSCNAIKNARSLKRFCKIMGFDLEAIRQEIAELNAKQHSLTDFMDEYANDSSNWSI